MTQVAISWSGYKREYALAMGLFRAAGELYNHECILRFLLFAPSAGLRCARHTHATIEVHVGNEDWATSVCFYRFATGVEGLGRCCCGGTHGVGANSQDVNKRLFLDFPVSIVKMAIGKATQPNRAQHRDKLRKIFVASKRT